MTKKDYLSIKEILKEFKTSDKTIRRYIASNDIESKKEGGKLRIKVSDIEKFFKKKEQKPKEDQNTVGEKRNKKESNSNYIEREKFYQNQISEKDKQLNIRAEEIKRKDEHISKILKRQGENNILMGNLEKKVNNYEQQLKEIREEKNKLLEGKTKEENLIVPYNQKKEDLRNDIIDVKIDDLNSEKEYEKNQKFYQKLYFIIPFLITIIIIVALVVFKLSL